MNATIQHICCVGHRASDTQVQGVSVSLRGPIHIPWQVTRQAGRSVSVSQVSHGALVLEPSLEEVVAGVIRSFDRVITATQRVDDISVKVRARVSFSLQNAGTAHCSHGL